MGCCSRAGGGERAAGCGLRAGAGARYPVSRGSGAPSATASPRRGGARRMGKSQSENAADAGRSSPLLGALHARHRIPRSRSGSAPAALPGRQAASDVPEAWRFIRQRAWRVPRGSGQSEATARVLLPGISCAERRRPEGTPSQTAHSTREATDESPRLPPAARRAEPAAPQPFARNPSSNRSPTTSRRQPCSTATVSSPAASRSSSRRGSNTRRLQPWQRRPISAPKRTTVHSYEPHGCGFRRRTTSPI